ncbi:MAG: hypothetical protein HYS15_02655 [Candidatus Spechtbacteria bacterium]|nr:hypothetical protein [Candidatus Spechtbacteria bacterium]
MAFGNLPREVREGIKHGLDELQVETDRHDWLNSNAGMSMAAEQYLHRFAMKLFVHGIDVLNSPSGVFIISRNGKAYALPQSAKFMLEKESDPEGATEQAIMLFVRCHACMMEVIRFYLKDNPIALSMFAIFLSHARSHEKVVAEVNDAQKDLQEAKAESRRLYLQIRKTAQALQNTKGFAKSKTIKQIREELEGALPAEWLETGGGAGWP